MVLLSADLTYKDRIVGGLFKNMKYKVCDPIHAGNLILDIFASS